MSQKPTIPSLQEVLQNYRQRAVETENRAAASATARTKADERKQNAVKSMLKSINGHVKDMMTEMEQGLSGLDPSLDDKQREIEFTHSDVGPRAPIDKKMTHLLSLSFTHPDTIGSEPRLRKTCVIMFAHHDGSDVAHLYTSQRYSDSRGKKEFFLECDLRGQHLEKEEIQGTLTVVMRKMLG